MSTSPPPEQLAVERAHAAAVAQEVRFYVDPRSGFRVMTELHHRARGFCCGSACRHCPYDWANVDADRFEAVDAARQARRTTRAAYAAALAAEGAAADAAVVAGRADAHDADRAASQPEQP